MSMNEVDVVPDTDPRLAVIEGLKGLDLKAGRVNTQNATLLANVLHSVRLGHPQVKRQAPNTEHVLLVGMHHIVADGWSLGIFLRELAALYGAYAAGEAAPLAELPVQYADFARWQRDWLTGEVLATQLDYWRRH